MRKLTTLAVLALTLGLVVTASASASTTQHQLRNDHLALTPESPGLGAAAVGCRPEHAREEYALTCDDSFRLSPISGHAIWPGSEGAVAAGGRPSRPTTRSLTTYLCVFVK